MMKLTPLTNQERKEARSVCTTLHSALVDTVVDVLAEHDRCVRDRVACAAVAVQALQLGACWYAGDRESFLLMAAMAYDGVIEDDKRH
jgi:hypothetical protein